MNCKRIRQAGSVTVGHPDAIDAYARELAARGETFTVDYMSDEIRHDTPPHRTAPHCTAHHLTPPHSTARHCTPRHYCRSGENEGHDDISNMTELGRLHGLIGGKAADGGHCSPSRG